MLGRPCRVVPIECVVRGYLTGVTGTSIWIDPDTGLWVILLTNRTYPERGESAISRVRPAVADLAVEAFEKGRAERNERGTTATDARYTGPVFPPATD